MGAKIDTTIPASVHENEYGPGTHEYGAIKVDFHSATDVLFLEQGGNQIIMDMTQLIELEEMMRKIF